MPLKENISPPWQLRTESKIPPMPSGPIIPPTLDQLELMFPIRAAIEAAFFMQNYASPAIRATEADATRVNKAYLMEKSMIEIVSNDPMDYVKVALAIETLAYHNKNYLDNILAKSNATISEEVQFLLGEAIKKTYR